jgi:Family of unknown function (DUF5681)
MADQASGRGKPPAHAQFKKGSSGNPRGRPKGSKNLTNALLDAAREEIVISENGRRRRISKGEAAAKQLVNRAASGDPKAVTQLLDRIARLEAAAGAKRPTHVIDDRDQQVITELYRRMKEVDKDKDK